MNEQNRGKLNWLERNLPEGLLVTASWLTEKGYSSSLRAQYVSAGWLEQPARGVYRRPYGDLRWEHAVISLQTILEFPVIVGGRTALELQGYAHYLPQDQQAIHLYGDQSIPNWLNKLGLPNHFHFRRSDRLFRNDPVARGLTSLEWNIKTGVGRSNDPLQTGLTILPWGHWDWPMTLSTPERAIFELLNELPQNESFHQADMLMESLANLSPRRVQKLLIDCKSVKVKRLFMFFAERHDHSWFKRIDRTQVDLGTGKRMLVKGGKLNKTYQITLPEDLDAI